VFKTFKKFKPFKTAEEQLMPSAVLED